MKKKPGIELHCHSVTDSANFAWTRAHSSEYWAVAFYMKNFSALLCSPHGFGVRRDPHSPLASCMTKQSSTAEAAAIPREGPYSSDYRSGPRSTQYRDKPGLFTL